jgi:hypothetical protein
MWASTYRQNGNVVFSGANTATTTDATQNFDTFSGGNYFPENTADTTIIAELTGSVKWTGGVLAPNGKIYGIPRTQTSVLIIDPVTNNANTTAITGLTGSNKWFGGVLAPNGKIYGIPWNSTSVLIIDPVTNTANTTAMTGFSGSQKWGGGVLE